MEWRLSEISNPETIGYDPTEPYKFEIQSPYESGELTTFRSSYTFPLVAVRPGKTYRARVRHLDSSGRWSHWSAPSEFIAETPEVAAYQNALVISEIMYNPSPPSGTELDISAENDDYEYLEIQNVSSETIDLTDVRFTKGIDFDFPIGTQIEPGQFLLIVKNVAAFEGRYGTGLPVIGSYGTDNLSNSGEQIKLSLGAGTGILDFVYGDSLPWPERSDGQGFSLILTDPYALPNHSLPASWSAGILPGGTPGQIDEGVSYQAWAEINEVIGSPNGDPDRDGITNLLEFALNGNPHLADLTILPFLEVNGNVLTLSFNRPAAAMGITYITEFSTDLINWSSDQAALVSSEISPEGLLSETWRYLPSIQDQSGIFARLRVTTN
jgi:hypothetical protein